jgi:hypothetical protein
LRPTFRHANYALPTVATVHPIDLSIAITEKFMRIRLAGHLLCAVALALTSIACDNSAMIKPVPSFEPAGSGNRGGASNPRGDDDAGVSRLEDGESCRRDSECESDHCDNRVCCSSGECCVEVEDCGDGDGVAQLCDDAVECQGTRGRVICNDNRCRTRDGEDDDRGCDARVEAADCGPYRSVYCNGDREQSAPGCETSCVTDSDCDRGVRCVDEACVDDRQPDGTACEQSSECASGVCEEGQCCAEDGACTTPEAVTEADQMRCLEVFTEFVTTDACRECACAQCAPSMLDCYDSGDAARDALCGAIPTCVYYAECIGDCSDELYGCYGELCYCGLGNPGCVDPYGPCEAQIEAAAGTEDVELLRERTRDPGFPLYYAHTYSECMVERCGPECSL